MSVTVAAVQFEPEQHDHERNRLRCIELMAEAADRGAKVVVAPEMATTGYCWTDRQHIAPYVEPANGRTAQLLQDLATRTGSWFVIGFAEMDPATGVFYNSALIVGDGVVDCYRKIQPYAADPRWAKDGDRGMITTATPWGKLGTAICMDAMFMETTRTLALAEADIICLPVNWFGERTPSAFWQARAVENGIAVIAANRWGEERGTQFAGGSCIIGPDGAILAACDDGDGIVIADMDIEAIRESRRQRLARRRPTTYYPLTLSSHSWEPDQHFNLYADQQLPERTSGRIAAIQSPFDPDWQQRLRSAADLIRTAQPCSIAVLPPLFEANDSASASAAAAVADDALLLLEDTAADLATTIITTVITGSPLHQSTVLIQPDGKTYYYHNNHPEPWFSPGEQWITADLDLARIGLLSATELTLPEPARCLAIAGTDIACVSGQTPAVDDWLLRIRAGENNMFLVTASYADRPGITGIFGPDAFANPRRETIACGGISIVTMDIDLATTDHTARNKPLLVMRHPTWFDALVTESTRQEE